MQKVSKRKTLKPLRFLGQAINKQPLSGANGEWLFARKQERGKKRKEESPDQPLHVLNRCRQEGLFAHIGEAEHTGNAQAAVFLGFRERSLNGFLAPGI